MGVRYFTVEKANQALPLVRRIVEDIVREYGTWKTLMRQYEVVTSDTVADPVAVPNERAAQVDLRERIEGVAQQIAGFVDELNAVGCVLKGFDDGLVDFYGRRGGRDIFLCWKLGEPEVLHWHEIDEGFAGRQPLEPEMVQEGR